MTRNSTTRVSLENDRSKPSTLTSPMPMQKVLISAITRAARKAPPIEPMPPTTTMTKASEITVMTSIRRSEEHTSDLQSLMRRTYAVFRLKTQTDLEPHVH